MDNWSVPPVPFCIDVDWIVEVVRTRGDVTVCTSTRAHPTRHMLVNPPDASKEPDEDEVLSNRSVSQHEEEVEEVALPAPVKPKRTPPTQYLRKALEGY